MACTTFSVDDAFGKELFLAIKESEQEEKSGLVKLLDENEFY